MANEALMCLKALAEVLHLKVVSEHYSAKHLVIEIQNEHGVTCRRTVSRNGDLGGRDRANMRGELRRFARGQYHGLRVQQ